MAEEEAKPYVAELDGEPVEPAAGWSASWDPLIPHVVRLSDGTRFVEVVVEGDGPDWSVTLHGRRMPVRVLSWREQVLAAAEASGASHTGPVEVTATLPGLVVAIHHEVGAEVAQGDALLTIEAMKMQNEVRAPRSGMVASVSVEAGKPVVTGQLLVRLE
jgi:acetyl/propionyl-CoA carboxylase alpha subunit